jgi:hypothetical protein
MGILDEQSPEQAEIARLENLVRQTQMGVASISDVLQAVGPSGVMGDERAQLEAQLAGLQQQQQGAQTDLQAAQQARLQAAQSPQMQPGGPSMQMQQAQGGAGGPQNPIYGLLGYDAGGGQGAGAQFQPSIPSDQIGEIYGLLAGGADDPATVGMNYVRAMQAQDVSKISGRDAKYRVTDAMRPKPVGSGYLDAEGHHVVPIWDPNLNDGRGGIREQRLGRRMPDTIKVGNIPYVRNPYVSNPQDPNYFIPGVDPSIAGGVDAEFTEESNLGSKRATTRGEASDLAADMNLQDSNIRGILFAENFSEATGPLDTFVAWAGGKALGGEDSLLNRQLGILHNQLVTTQVSDWKGAISERELDFFHASVPETTDHHQVWMDWYENVYVPTMVFAMKRAKGEVDFTSGNLKDFIESGGAYAQGSEAEQILSDPALQKYLN